MSTVPYNGLKTTFSIFTFPSTDTNCIQLLASAAEAINSITINLWWRLLKAQSRGNRAGDRGIVQPKPIKIGKQSQLRRDASGQRIRRQEQSGQTRQQSQLGWDGMLPVSPFVCKFRKSNLVSNPSCDGMVPLRSFAYKSSAVKSVSCSI